MAPTADIAEKDHVWMGTNQLGERVHGVQDSSVCFQKNLWEKRIFKFVRSNRTDHLWETVSLLYI